MDKIWAETEGKYDNQFLRQQDIVLNALDNVQARKYIDERCVINDVALIDSGTLGSQGHVQVIVPHKTENYRSQEDPDDNNEIPHCTLKMFPEKALHCVEWARDLFGKYFTKLPKSLFSSLKFFENLEVVIMDNPQKVQEAVEFMKMAPKSFSGCVK